MAADSYIAGYYKYFGDKITKVTRESTAEDVMQLYKEWAPDYDKEIATARCVKHKIMADCVDSAVKKLFPEKHNSEIEVFDVAAGTGIFGRELQKLGFTNVDALDISQEMLNEAKKKNVYNKFICAPLTGQRTAGIETGQYDVLTCSGAFTISYIKSTTLLEMIRMVRIGGLVCFNMREDDMKDYEEQMVELKKAGKWEEMSKEAIPHYDTDELPRVTILFLYKVLEHV